MMIERSDLTPEELQLDLLIEESKDAGKRTKQLLLKVLAQKLPELPLITAYNPSGHFMNTKDIYALVIESGGLGKEFSWYQSKYPDPEPFVAMTMEGIFRVPVRAAGISTNYSVLAADWDKRQELTPLEYLALTLKTLQAIHDEAQKLTPVH